METKTDLVQKLWGLCNILRDDGITYHQYVSELTYLLFLKMSEETGSESELPKGYRWSDLSALKGPEQFDFYRKQLVKLGTEGSERVRAIFANPTSLLRHAENLNALVTRIDSLDWFNAHREGLGDIYEGLLEKNASEKKSGAGQYFTPRPLIECMVAAIKPRNGEVIQDPAAGTGGFIIVANEYAKSHYQRERKARASTSAFHAVELVQDTFRLLLMNVILHGIDGNFTCGDSLTPKGLGLPKADLILTNPPFGTKRGGYQSSREDLAYATSNKQLSFLQHVYEGLKPGGRAAVVVPDNVLFEDGVARQIRSDLMAKCRLHTILRLPTGIFYVLGVKTNVLFFSRCKNSDNTSSDEVWIYDLRTNMPSFGKRIPLTRQHFSEFEAAYGDDAHGRSCREDQGEKGRFRSFSREEIQARGYNLDIVWLRDGKNGQSMNLAEPEAIVAMIFEKLRIAITEMEATTALLADNGESQ